MVTGVQTCALPISITPGSKIIQSRSQTSTICARGLAAERRREGGTHVGDLETELLGLHSAWEGEEDVAEVVEDFWEAGFERRAVDPGVREGGGGVV